LKSKPLIGVADLAMNRWTAGGIVSRTMALSLQAAGAEVVFLTARPENSPADVRPSKLPKLTYLPGEWTLRKLSGRDKGSSMANGARSAGIDVLLPDVEALGSSSLHTVGWIPDFQHLHLSELYSGDQRKLLDRAHHKLARKSSRMLFSSEDCRRDFVQHFPAFSEKARVASFPSILAFEPPSGSPAHIFEKYHLPERFLLVINQFWRHKNHRIVPEALAILRARGLQVPVVMAGLPADYRDRNNDALSETLQAAVRGHVWPQCFILGKVPREDLIALLRTAAAIIQPSRFEGWNTTVQDAKAIGCPVIVSDLAVHREQCPKALGYFAPDNAEALADVIAANWSNLSTRPNAGESEALAAELENARVYGRKLEEICTEIV
jgi:glycosyltransferase involved in cell wall biosynthesis